MFWEYKCDPSGELLSFIKKICSVVTHSRYVKKAPRSGVPEKSQGILFTWRLPPVGGCTLWRRIGKKEKG